MDSIPVDKTILICERQKSGYSLQATNLTLHAKIELDEYKYIVIPQLA